MFHNDVSYLYSDDYLTSSISSEQELSPKVSKIFDYEPIRLHVYGKSTPIDRRSKHIFVFNEEVPKRDKRRQKNRITIGKFKGKRESVEQKLHKKIKQLENEQSHLEIHLEQLRLYKNDLETEMNNNLCTNPILEISLMDKEKIPFVFDQYIDDSDLSNMVITDTFNTDIDN